jgi:uncharacterized membrane protein
MANMPPPIAEQVAVPASVSETTGLPRNIAAGLANIFPLVGGVVFLVLERRDRFVRFYAVQSILLGAVAVLVWMSIELVNFIFSHIPLIGGFLGMVMGGANRVFSLAWFVVYVVVIVKAFMGKEWEIPYLGQVARRQTAERPAV